MYRLLKPKIVIPVHGEARHLIAQAHFARDSGIGRVITPHNGVVIQLAGDEPGIIGEVPVGKWAVDGNRMIAFDGNITRARTKLSEQGVVFVTLVTEKSEVSRVEVSIIGLEEQGKMLRDLENFVRNEMKSMFKRGQVSSSNVKAIENVVSNGISKKLGKRPIVEVHLVAV
jgi:ribonuclease J